MGIFLTERAEGIQEKMEDPDCNRELLFNTYQQFKTINYLLSGWKSLYRQHIYPLLATRGHATLLDIGFGGGDLPFFLHRRAEQDGFDLHITAIETDSRAMEFVESEHAPTPSNIDFRHADIGDFLPVRKEEEPFDFIISNHLLHHLASDDLIKLARQSEELVRHKVIFNDLERNGAAYLLFSAFIAPFFRRSFAARDGRRSIRRSFTRSELERTLPSCWTVTRQFPFRLIASYVSD